MQVNTENLKSILEKVRKQEGSIQERMDSITELHIHASAALPKLLAGYEAGKELERAVDGANQWRNQLKHRREDARWMASHIDMCMNALAKYREATKI